MRTVETKQLIRSGAQPALNVPNLISLVRIVLAPVVFWAIVREHRPIALILFGVAAATDFLDGYLARRLRVTTSAGQYLDPVADKFLLCLVFLALGSAALVPWWFVAIVFGRDLALLVASAIAMKVSRYNNYRPTPWGKVSTVLQVVAAIGALACSAAIARALIEAAAVATIWSAIHYTWRGVNFFFTKIKV